MQLPHVVVWGSKTKWEMLWWISVTTCCVHTHHCDQIMQRNHCSVCTQSYVAFSHDCKRQSWGPSSSQLEEKQLDNNSWHGHQLVKNSLDFICVKTRGYWAGFFLFFLLLIFFFLSPSPLCCRCLHASPSSQRIYRGEKDLKGLEKSSIVYWFYNRLSAREIKCGAGGVVWSTRGDGVTNTRLIRR